MKLTVKTLAEKPGKYPLNVSYVLVLSITGGFRWEFEGVKGSGRRCEFNSGCTYVKSLQMYHKS